MARTAKELSHLRLRVEATLLAKLEKAAEKNGRTLTGEITHRLEESFAKEDMIATIEAVADRLAEKVGKVIISAEGDRVTVVRGDKK